MAKLDPSVHETINKILAKDLRELTDNDRAFLRARESYLTRTQKADLGNALKPPKKVEAQEEDVDVAIEDIIKGRNVRELPDSTLKKVAKKLGIETKETNKEELAVAISTKLGPEADKKPE